MRSILSALIISILVGCGTPPGKSENGSPNGDPNNVNDEPNNDVNSQNGCDGPAPGCGVCEAPVCEDGGWKCLGTPCVNPGCQEPAPGCGVCEAPVCEDSTWRCVAQNGPDCESPQCAPNSTSTLNGVSIEFAADRCTWTLAEAAAGIEIPYTIRIVEEQTIMPTSQQNGCDVPGPSGLRQQERVHGGDHLYCLCDVGLCMADNISVSLVPGDYEFAVVWDGVNWTGPSDFGNPKGEPFPPGIYNVEVRAIGTVDGDEYEVTGVLPLSLVE